MPDFDYQNWNKERRILKDEIFQTLRQQRDQGEEVTYSGAFTINPQAFSGPGEEKTYHNIFFPSIFRKVPVVTFGQVPRVDSQEPFVVIPSVKTWIWNSGAVEGFVPAVYTITGPPLKNANSVREYTIMWMARGVASLYKRDHVKEAWNQSYDNEHASEITIGDAREYDL